MQFDKKDPASHNWSSQWICSAPSLCRQKAPPASAVLAPDKLCSHVSAFFFPSRGWVAGSLLLLISVFLPLPKVSNAPSLPVQIFQTDLPVFEHAQTFCSAVYMTLLYSMRKHQTQSSSAVPGEPKPHRPGNHFQFLNFYPGSSPKAPNVPRPSFFCLQEAASASGLCVELTDGSRVSVQFFPGGSKSSSFLCAISFPDQMEACYFVNCPVGRHGQ